MVGIIAFGAYAPRLRLQRQVIAAAGGWFNSSLKGLAKGERAMANWDEDTVTMAVEAARDCLIDLDRARVAKVVLASTSLPFADRQNAGIVKEALNLSDATASMDVTGSQRAGASALVDALYAAGGGAGEVLCLASERRKAQPASELEATGADAAAGFLVGQADPLAVFLGGHSVSIDFVDHFRAEGHDYDYGWEARWVRDEGYGKIAPAAIKAALAKLGLAAGDIDRFVMAAPMKGVNDAVAKACGFRPEAVQDPLAAELGDAGAAQPLILLARALETAKPDQTILVAAFGQGCDVLVFRTTAALAAPSSRLGVGGWLARRKPESNYIKYLFFSGQLALDKGMRAEFDQKTSLTALYRSRKAVMALVGGQIGRAHV